MKRPLAIAILTLAAVGLLALAASQAHADLIVVAPTSSANGRLTITNDITVTITTAGKPTRLTGNMFIPDGNGTRLSNIVAAGAVPEPTTLGLLVVGGIIGLTVARRH